MADGPMGADTDLVESLRNSKSIRGNALLLAKGKTDLIKEDVARYNDTI